MSGMTIAAAVAVGASAVGLGLALRTKKSDDGLEAKPSRADELEAQYQFVLKEIRALDAEKHQHIPEEYERERERLTREAVRLLKAAEGTPKKKGKANHPVTAATPSPAAAEAKAQSGWLGALAGAGTVMLATLVAMSVWNTASPRSDGSLTGGNDRMAQAQQQADGIAEALAFVREHPEDVDASAEVARELLQRNRLDEASELIDAALAVSPQHVASRILRLVIDGTRGDAYSAMEALKRIAEEGPEGREALLYRGTMALRVEDRATALDSFERYAKEAPASEHPQYLTHVLDILREKDAPQQ